MSINKFKLSVASSLTTLLLLVCLVTSCGKDNDPDDPNSNLPAGVAKEFVRAWKSTTGSLTLVFYNDGYVKQDGQYFGKWTYNKETNILATTVNNLQFQITLTSDNEWAAICISNNLVYTFKRITGGDLAKAILDGATAINLDDENRESHCSVKFYMIDGLPGMYYVSFSEENGEYEYDEYYVNGSGKKNWISSGKAGFKNMVSATSCRLTLKRTSESGLVINCIIDNTGK